MQTEVALLTDFFPHFCASVPNKSLNVVIKMKIFPFLGNIFILLNYSSLESWRIESSRTFKHLKSESTTSNSGRTVKNNHHAEPRLAVMYMLG